MEENDYRFLKKESLTVSKKVRYVSVLCWMNPKRCIDTITPVLHNVILQI